MSSSHHEDYLLRQIKVVGEMLARILGLRLSGKGDEARTELDKAYELLLGPRTALLRRIDAPTAAALLGSPDAILALARLFNEEADQCGDADRGMSLRVRAVALGVEAAQRDNANEAIRDFLAGLARVVDLQQLTPRQRATLASAAET
jgi:hypothetical protein